MVTSLTATSESASLCATGDRRSVYLLPEDSYIHTRTIHQFLSIFKASNFCCFIRIFSVKRHSYLTP